MCMLAVRVGGCVHVHVHEDGRVLPVHAHSRGHARVGVRFKKAHRESMSKSKPSSSKHENGCASAEGRQEAYLCTRECAPRGSMR